jgi:hypothetical protein
MKAREDLTCGVPQRRADTRLDAASRKKEQGNKTVTDERFSWRGEGFPNDGSVGKN